jgi:hypothetical protein
MITTIGFHETDIADGREIMRSHMIEYASPAGEEDPHRNEDRKEGRSDQYQDDHYDPDLAR